MRSRGTPQPVAHRPTHRSQDDQTWARQYSRGDAETQRSEQGEYWSYYLFLSLRRCASAREISSPLPPPRRSSVASMAAVVVRDFDLAEHACLHVIEQVAVVRPATECVRGDGVADLLGWMHDDGMLADLKLTAWRFDLAPHAVQMNGVRHHRVVHERDAQSLTMSEAKRRRLGELLAVERPDEALHVTGEVQADLSTWRAHIDRAADRVQIGIRQHVPPVIAEPDARIVQARADLLRHHIDGCAIPALALCSTQRRRSVRRMIRGIRLRGVMCMRRVTRRVSTVRHAHVHHREQRSRIERRDLGFHSG